MDGCCWYLVLYMLSHGMTTVPGHYFTRDTCVAAGEAWKKENEANYTPRFACIRRPNQSGRD